MEFKNKEELLSALKGIINIKNNKKEVEVLNPTELKHSLIDRLIFTAVFSDQSDLKKASQWLIRAAATAQNIHLSSIQSLYEAMGKGLSKGYTVPAINIRGMTYDFSRSILRAAERSKSFPVIFEIARSEIGYTFQNPAEYAACVTAAAIKESYQGPLFIQGDHFQVNAKKFNSADKDKELNSIYSLIDEALDAGFYNIDIDTSTLVDLSFPTVLEQQRNNFEYCAAYTQHIRKKQPQGIEVSVGGEIGEVGHKNSTVEELEAFMTGYLTSLSQAGASCKGISKMSVQTGTSHGGIPLPDGSVAKVKLDFETLKQISEVAKKKYALSGAVQHGASTLPDDLFDRFPQVEASEIHLATGFQNMIYDHPSLPKDLKDKVYAWLAQNCASERKDGETDEQFFYKTRKKGFGPLKREFWTLPEAVKAALADSLESKFVFLFQKLNVAGKKEELIKFCPTQAVHSQAPQILL